jgi:hypothetical protein
MQYRGPGARVGWLVQADVEICRFIEIGKNAIYTKLFTHPKRIKFWLNPFFRLTHILSQIFT